MDNKSYMEEENEPEVIRNDNFKELNGLNGHVSKDDHENSIEIETDLEPLYLYDVHDNPNVFLTVTFALQVKQSLYSFKISFALKKKKKMLFFAQTCNYEIAHDGSAVSVSHP